MTIVLDTMDPSRFPPSMLVPGSAAAVSAVDPPAECCSSSSSSSSSSIGRNSDEDGDGDGRLSTDGEDCKEDEAQSAYKGPLDMMESIEEVLPIRRGISKFYSGKSKSFASLAEASSVASIKDIAKAENAYTRRQRNLMASSHFWEKKRIMKKPISPSKSFLALAMVMSSSELSSSGCTSEDSCSSINSRSPPRLPPVHPQSRGSSGNFSASSPPKQGFSSWRSYSVADLPECALSARVIPR